MWLLYYIHTSIHAVQLSMQPIDQKNFTMDQTDWRVRGPVAIHVPHRDTTCLSLRGIRWAVASALKGSVLVYSTADIFQQGKILTIPKPGVLYQAKLPPTVKYP